MAQAQSTSCSSICVTYASKSARRRARRRRTAVLKAKSLTNDIRETFPFLASAADAKDIKAVQSTSSSSEHHQCIPPWQEDTQSLHIKLDRLENTLQQILSTCVPPLFTMGNGAYDWHPDLEPYLGDSDKHCGDALLESLQQVASPTKSSSLNPQAPVFAPKSVYSYEQHCEERQGGLESAMRASIPADFRRLPEDGWHLMYSKFPSLRTACKRCDQEHEECMCDEIFCRNCMKLAGHCSCEYPLVKRRVCSECACVEDSDSIFEVSDIQAMPPIQPIFRCLECGTSDFESFDYYCVQSAKVCGCCGRLGYLDMNWCDSRSCPSEDMFHTSCLQEVRGRKLCSDCVSAATEEIEHDGCSESEIEQDDPANSYESSTDQQREALFSFWSEDEIMVWMQVTLRMRDALSNAESQTNLVQNRWTAAINKIPPHMRQRLKNLIEEKLGVSLSDG